MANKNNGCHKCDYTGFSYGKIPCVCSEAAPPEKKVGERETPVTGVVTYEPGDTVYLFEIPIGVAKSASQPDGTVEIALNDLYSKSYGIFVKVQVTKDYSKVATPPPLKEKFNVGDTVYCGDQYLGIVLKADDTKVIEVANFNYTTLYVTHGLTKAPVNTWQEWKAKL